MNQTNTARKRVVVVGGGITGLAAAHRLVELDANLEVTLLEADGRLGGVLETVQRDGFLLERSADNFITNIPWAVDLCSRIGFSEQLIPTSTSERNAMVVYRGRLEKVPPGFMLLAPSRIGPLLSTPILSPLGKLRLLAEYFIPRRKGAGDESLASFARRRLGRETFERIVQPLVGGIYTADPEKLSLLATLPRFLEMEHDYGSLIRGALAQRDAAIVQNGENDSGARYGMFVAPRAGMSSLVQAIADRLPVGSVQLNSPVEQIARESTGNWNVQFAGANGNSTLLECAGLIVAVAAPCAARLLSGYDPELAGDLNRIPYAGSTIVTLAFRREQIDHPLDGFGFVVPAVENRKILAGSFSSVKFPGRAPGETVLIRVFVGGACQSELADLGDDELRAIVANELGELLGAHGAPLFSTITRWPHAMPQYHLGHLDLVAGTERRAAQWPNFALAGNAYHGVGIPHCIHSGEQAAERILAAMRPA